MNTKRNVFLWALYDFANSFTQIAFSLYFAQWLVIEQGISDLRFNLAFVIAAVLLLLTVPFVGFLLDTRFRHISGLRITTGLMALLYGVAALCAVQGNAYGALWAFTGGFYSFLLTFTFYTPLLYDIASTERRGRVSGYGFAANFMGQIASVLVALPFAVGAITIFGGSSRAETLLPAVALFIIFALPMLLWFREPHKEIAPFYFKKECATLFSSIKLLFTTQGVGLFLLAHFLFFDAILTASNNFSIFLGQVWGVSDIIKSYILLGIFITSAAGALIAGIVADKIGHKRTFVGVVAGWLVILPVLAITKNFGFFVAMTTVMGFWFGASWALSRTMMLYLAPASIRNLSFGFFGLIERASSLLGPVVWGMIATGMISYGSDRYRWSMLAMMIFVLFACITLLKVKSDRTT